MVMNSGSSYPDSNPPRGRTRPTIPPDGQRSHTLYPAETFPYRFGLSEQMTTNPYGRPWRLAALAPLIVSTPVVLKALKFVWTMSGGDATSSGATYIGSATLPRPIRLARVYIHSPWWPFERLAVLTTAHNVDRSYERMGQGHAICHISYIDPQLTRDVVSEGNLLVIQTDDQPDWVGTIVTLTETLESGQIELSAYGLAATLDGRIAPQGEQYTRSTGSGVIFESLITRMNARSHTGVFRPSIVDTGPSVEQLQVGGQSVMQALNDLHNATDYEWWMEYDVRPTRIESTIHWGFRQGRDISGAVHLYQGLHFNQLEYKLDLSQVKQVVTAIGDFGADLTQRNSVAHAITSGTQHADTGAAIVNIASTDAVRAVSAFPPGLRNERVLFELMTGDSAELGRKAKRALERPFASAEQFAMDVNRTTDWTNFEVGNYITIHAELGMGSFNRRIRIVGVQPEEERARIMLVCEVPIN